MNQFFKYAAGWLMFFVVVMYLIRGYQSPKPQSDWDYSKFVTQVEAGNVKDVEIHPEDRFALGTAKDDTHFKAVIPDDPNQVLTNLLLSKNVQVKIDAPMRVSLFWQIMIQIAPFLIIFGWFFFMMRQAQSGSGGALAFGKSRARLMTSGQQKVTFLDVAGVEEAKTELMEVVDFLKDPKKYQQLGGKIPKGVILLGPPGTGKTLLAKAVAGEAGVPFFSISGSDFVEMFVGVGAARVRDLFEQGKKHAPCIIFIDEIDAVGRQRGAGLGGGHDEREQTLNALLVEMDGFNTNTGVILIAATNRMDVLDPALLRPGRFDRQIVVDRPDLGGREAILKVHAKNIKLAQEIDLAVIARRTPGFSGADLANLINEAALLAARRNKKAVEMPELEEAIDRVMAGPERRTRVISDEEKKIVAFHESGHTIVGKMVDKSHSVHKVSIIPRGHAALGATWYLPKEERFLASKTELLNRITALLGGRTAEELTFGDVTTGAGDDLNRATEMARAMVCEYGMSEKMGSITLGRKDDMVFIGRDLMKEKNYSEQTAQMIDAEVKRIVEDCHKKATDILKKNRKFLKAMAEALLEREVLDSSDVDDILAGRKIGPKPTSPSATPPTPTTPIPAEVTPKVTLKPQANPSQAMRGGRIG
ncbi:MAG TPA: ATP-dependent zinc metalloprotease FtsH [bacterium]|nr:ATP-dependent zinc metalloprotease FtsH [bacterium]